MDDIPDRLIATTLDADGVLVATIDMPGRTMNVFSAGLMDALEALLDRVEGDDAVQSVVLGSGKPSFIAGADLAMVRGYADLARTASRDEVFATCGRLGRLFLRLEASAKPWVAAVNGIALGGGLELALACRERIVADDPRIQIGVPEVRLGLLPGAGGTQRLPRLAPFDAAMDLLLSGRSIAPTQAVELGVFDAAVPAASLLGAAHARAVGLRGQPYDVARKFARLAQSEVPPWSEDNARILAAQHGVDATRFALYPAYSAICDSVLLGARRSLADATAVEMKQFVRLMFSPVAGRMIRTLFLERLRAERELAAPPATRVAAVEHGVITPARGAWAAALAKLEPPVREAPELPADTLEVVDDGAARHRFALCVLDEAGVEPAGATLVLAPRGPYGRVVEIVGAAAGPQADAAAALAATMGLLPWRTPGPRSALQRLRGLRLPDQAREAAAIAAEPGAGDAVFLDVAACLAGIAPAWSGGPLIWSRSGGEMPAAAEA